jgi:hypothetical protein
MFIFFVTLYTREKFARKQQQGSSLQQQLAWIIIPDNSG